MIFLGADHRGFSLKENLKEKLTDAGFEVRDLGNDHLDPEDDYTDFARAVAEMTMEKEENRGILVCGSGVGVDMVANKIPGIRSSLVFDVARSKQSREHEDVNVLALAADVLDEELAWKIVEVFLKTPFSGEERHLRRLEKIKQIEEVYFK